MLAPAARRSLIGPLGEICCDPDRPPPVQAAAAEALAEIHKAGDADEVLAFLRGVLDRRLDGPCDESRMDNLAARQSVAAMTLASLGDLDTLWPRLSHSGDPRLRSLLIWQLGAHGLPTRVLLDRLASPGVPPIERQALLMALSDPHHLAAATADMDAVIEAALRLYRDDPDPGVHSASELLLRRCSGDMAVASCDEGLKNPVVGAGIRRWERGPNGHTFAVLPAPLDFPMGSPEHEDGHDKEERLHYRRIDRSLAVSTKEVGVAQFRDLLPDLWKAIQRDDRTDGPANYVSWYDAVRYCNALDAKAGLPPSQWCYPEYPGPGMVISEEAVDRPGFRLPTEAESEYFIRAGTETAWSFGHSAVLLPRYAWTSLSPQDFAPPSGRLLPNDFGIFDAHGNLWEWCQDGAGLSTLFPDCPKPAYPIGTREGPASDPGQMEVMAQDIPGIDTWRMVRGGAFDFTPKRSRSASRDWAGPDYRTFRGGFRVVRTIPPEKPR